MASKGHPAARRKRRASERSDRHRAPRPAPHFVGRDPSPVLDRYPPRSAAQVSPRAPPPAVPPARSPTPTPGGPPTSSSAAEGSTRAGGGSPPPEGLIRLERPFDPDDFSQLLGETAIRITVPTDALPEVLRRVTDFMGFGIYVYAITVRPAPSDLLKGFVVELQRVEYDPEAGAWKPFVERGAASSPGGSLPGADA